MQLLSNFEAEKDKNRKQLEAELKIGVVANKKSVLRIQKIYIYIPVKAKFKI